MDGNLHSPWCLNQLLYEFGTEEAVKGIILAAEAAEIGAVQLLNFVEAIKFLRDRKNEGEPIRTAFAFCREAPKYLIRSSLVVNLDEPNVAKKILELVKIVDGSTGAVVIVSPGTVVGLASFPNGVLPPSNDLCCAEDELNLYTFSREANAAVFRLLGNGEVTVVMDAEQFLHRKEGTWKLARTRTLYEDLEKLLSEVGCVPEVTRILTREVVHLSKQCIAGTFVVGDSSKILTLCAPFNRDNPVIFEPFLIQDVPNYTLSRFANIDGAIIIDCSGCLIAAGQRLLGPNALVSLGQHTGSRHTTAAEITKVTKSVALVVAHEGDITVFSGGNFRIEW